MLDKEFVPYKESLELKELGFNEGCFAKFIRGSFQFNSLGGKINFNDGTFGVNIISSPTFSQAFRWFREKYGWVAEIHGSLQVNHFYANLLLQAKGEVRNIKMCDTYEEAELECLRKLIEIVKNK